jgi:glycine/D-amino acid oxidase-like deaminating enzyme
MDARSQHSQVVVIGGGIAGLCAGISAARAGVSVRLLDAHPIGGRARTAEQHGYLLNVGPHALYLKGALAGMLTSWGAMPDGGNPLAKSAKGWLAGDFDVLPGDPVSLMRSDLLSASSKVRFAKLFASLPRLDPATLEGRSVSEWLSGKPADLHAVVEAIIRLSTYTDLPDQFDAGAAVAQAKLGLAGVIYLDGGWQSIVDSLRRALEALGGLVVESAPVTSLHDDANGCVVGTVDGEWLGDSVVIACGGPAAMANVTGLAVSGADRLGPPIEAACLDVGSTRAPRHSIVLGIDRPMYASVHGPVARLAPAGRTLTTIMKYLRPGDVTSMAADNRAELEELRQALELDASVTEHDRFLGRLTVAHAVPTVDSGGMSGRPSVDAYSAAGHDRWLIAGDWVGDTGMLADASAASGAAAGMAAVRAVHVEGDRQCSWLAAPAAQGQPRRSER